MLIPVVINDNKKIQIDKFGITEIMRSFALDSQTIRNTTIYLDSKNHFINNGVTYPKWLGRIGFLFDPKLSKAPGQIVKINLKVRGKNRNKDMLNKTLVHELAHVAQTERNDLQIYIGVIVIYGLLIAGGLFSYGLGTSLFSKASLVVIGAMIGYQIGYSIAPHEREARKISSKKINRVFL